MSPHDMPTQAQKGNERIAPTHW